MAQQIHVPAWGNWEEENTQYTTVFEKARKVREPGHGRKVIDPNDHKENPYSSSRQHQHKDPRMELDNGDHRRGGSGGGMYDSEFPRLRRDRTSSSIDSSSDKRSTDHVRRHPGHQHKVSEVSSDGSNYSHASPSRHHPGKGVAKVRYAENQPKKPSVPKFGDWNERGDPSSTEGYTVIFNKVKEEKANASGKRQSMTHTPIEYQNAGNKNSSSTERKTKFKICSCFAA